VLPEVFAVPPLAVFALGFLLGMRHATDADHVVAVSALVGRDRSPRAALVLGSLWGIGHTLTLLVVGGAIILFGLVIPPRLALALEMSVAVMLIFLGGTNLVHAARFRHGPNPHGATPGARASLGQALGQGGRSLLVGVVHGLAGSAAIALLVLTTLARDPRALLYLAVFGAGTIAGMLLITASLAWPLQLVLARFATSERWLLRATGALSLAFGLFLAYRIGFVDGLLAFDPKLTPQ
jgi:high-affinity nickel-transport protein